EIEEIMKTKFICEHPHPKWFSMSDCSVSLANSFLTFIIDFCIKQDIPFKTKVIDEIWNDYGLIRECCLHRKCVICGKRAQIHHVDTIGMGNNRTEVNHIGRKILPLCVIHHREFHDIGAITFFRKYQVKPIKVDKELAVKLRLESQERVNNTNGDFRETPKTSTNL
ncbi:putative HNHc nuclease, partial [Fructilactobacillus florum]